MDNGPWWPKRYRRSCAGEGVPKPYELLKALTRGQGGITETTIRDFIAGLDVGETVKAELMAITPHNYIGTTGG